MGPPPRSNLDAISFPETAPRPTTQCFELDNLPQDVEYGTLAHLNIPQKKQSNNCIENVLIFLSIICIIIFFPISCIFIFVSIRQFERAVILRNGKVRDNRIFGPGLIFIMPCVDTIKYIDLRIVCDTVPPQEALTKDSLTVSVDAVLYYKVIDPITAVLSITNYRQSTQLLAATTLRNALGVRKLHDLLNDRPEISNQVRQQVSKLTVHWGISIIRVDIKDIRLPLQLQKAMAAEAESFRLANAKIIVAKAEVESTKNLEKATEILADNYMCMQLRYLQSLHTISGSNTHTIVFPFSTEILRKIFK